MRENPCTYVAEKFKFLKLKIEDVYMCIGIRGMGYIYISESGKCDSKRIRKFTEFELSLLKEFLKSPNSYNLIPLLEKSKEAPSAEKNVLSFLSGGESPSLSGYCLRIWGPSVDYIKSFSTVSQMNKWVASANFSAASVHEYFWHTSECLRIVLDVDGVP